MCPTSVATPNLYCTTPQKSTVVITVHTRTHLPRQPFRGAREAKALSEELSLDSSCFEAVSEDRCGRGCCAWQKRSTPEVLQNKTGSQKAFM